MQHTKDVSEDSVLHRCDLRTPQVAAPPPLAQPSLLHFFERFPRADFRRA
jgi:hypothetical protein